MRKLNLRGICHGHFIPGYPYRSSLRDGFRFYQGNASRIVGFRLMRVT